MRASANPGGAGHGWIKRRFINACKPDGTPVKIEDIEGGYLTRAFIQAFVEDNPALIKNDPKYLTRLNLLSKTARQQLRFGDWDAGEGLALEDMNEAMHIVPSFALPAHWTQFGSFDWGFRHPFVFCHFAMDEDGTVYLVNTVRGRKMKPMQIAARIQEKVDTDALDYIDAGHDCWAEMKARGEDTPGIAEQFERMGIYLRKANISRRAGLNNMRAYLDWRGVDVITAPDGTEIFQDGEPRCYLMDTPDNRAVFDCLASMATDPFDQEDALKKDADENGIGGDDEYDAMRYGLASRPVRARAPEKPQLGVWSREVLAAEAAYKRISRSRDIKQLPAHSENADGIWEVN
jgi:hypothetical protein